MFEELRKLLLAGIGGAALTGEKAVEVINRLVERGKLTVDEGKKLTDELIQKTKDSREKETLDKEELQAVLLEKNFAQQKDIEALEERVQYLEKEADIRKNKQ